MNSANGVSETDRFPALRNWPSESKKAVRLETSSRVHNLGVQVTGTHVVLEGFCSSFHCFQLAQHAAMRLAEDLPVDNRIEVL